MNDNLQQMVIIAAIAIYKTKGVAEALAYLTKHSFMSFDEAVEVLALYDKFEAASIAGTLY